MKSMSLTAKDNYSWFPAHDADRTFVKHKHPEPPAGSVRIITPSKGTKIEVSIVIPTMDGDRNGCLEQLLDQVALQTLRGIEVIIIKGDTRQGRSINIGAAFSRGKYLLTLDDDTSLPDKESVEKLVQVMKDNPDIGIAGGNAVIPNNAPSFVKKAMTQIPRRAWKPVNEITDSDLVQHPCMIMRTDEFKKIGGENELIPRGLDPYLREQMRLSGFRVVLIPGVNYYHLLPGTLTGLMRQFRRNGKQAAFVNINFPQWVIETPASHGSFRPRVPLTIRVFRLPLRLLWACMRGDFIRLLCELNYAIGFTNAWFFLRGETKMKKTS